MNYNIHYAYAQLELNLKQEAREADSDQRAFDQNDGPRIFRVSIPGFTEVLFHGVQQLSWAMQYQSTGQRLTMTHPDRYSGTNKSTQSK